MAEFTLLPYQPSYKQEWDTFTDNSKNGTILHRRDYLEYHADRFPDHSLMIYRDGKLYALFPATFDGKRFSSHRGLTYGGIILNKRATMADVLKAMELIRTYVRGIGAKEFIYKPIPHIYHQLPAEEDLYALFRMNATLIIRNVSAVIENRDAIKLRADRKAGLRKAINAGITIEKSENYAAFWEILTANLSARYNASPVHTLKEILSLKDLFPQNIHLHIARKDNEILGGCVVYTTPTVAHTQYISASPEGKELHALDLLLSRLAQQEYSTYRYFDFGTSNEDNGRYLNENLISQKEGFGARSIVYDTYSIPL